MVRQDLVHKDSEFDAGWEQCTPGTIGDLRNRLNAGRRRRFVVRIGTPVVVLAMLGIGVYTLGGSANLPGQQEQNREFNFGGVTCSVVRTSMQRFSMGQLTPDQQLAFTTHLQQCPVCQDGMEAMRESEMPVVNESLISSSPTGFQTHRTLLTSHLDRQCRMRHHNRR